MPAARHPDIGALLPSLARDAGLVTVDAWAEAPAGAGPGPVADYLNLVTEVDPGRRRRRAAPVGHGGGPAPSGRPGADRPWTGDVAYPAGPRPAGSRPRPPRPRRWRWPSRWSTRGVAALAAAGGPDMAQVLAYDVAHAAAAVRTAEAVLAYGAYGDSEAAHRLRLRRRRPRRPGGPDRRARREWGVGAGLDDARPRRS